MAVSRKAMTEGLSERDSSDPLSPSVRTGAAPLGQQGEPLAANGRPYKKTVNFPNGQCHSKTSKASSAEPSRVRHCFRFIRVFNKTLKSVLLGRRIAACGHRR